MKVAVCGTGFVGLTTGVAMAYVGHEVAMVDRDEERIRRLSAREVPVREPWLADLLQLSRNNVRFTASCKEAVFGADAVFLALDGECVEGAEEAVAKVCGEMNAKPAAIVNRTSLPIGSARRLADAVRRVAPAGRKARIALVCNPEFIREGSAVQDSLYPDRVVVGSDEPWSTRLMQDLYQPILEQTFTPPKFLPRSGGTKSVPLVTMNLASAELLRHAATVFLALKISYINEIAMLAEQVGADASNVARAMGLDPRIGISYMTPGAGWGGPSLSKDVGAVIAAGEELGLEMPIAKAAQHMNALQRERVVDKLRWELGELQGRKVALLGLAFKPGTDDLADAPAVDIARRLLEAGARVKAHDPRAVPRFQSMYPELPVRCCTTAEEAADGTDGLVLVTEWPDYLYVPWEAVGNSMATKLAIDGRCFLPRERLERAGFRYVGLGRLSAPGTAAVQPAGLRVRSEAVG